MKKMQKSAVCQQSAWLMCKYDYLDMSLANESSFAGPVSRENCPRSRAESEQRDTRLEERL